MKDINYFVLPGRRDANKLLPKEWWDKEEEWFHRANNCYCGMFPLNIDVEVSSLCNLRCKMCTIDFDKFKGGLMPLDLFKHIASQFNSSGPAFVKFNWRGEPLINKRLAKMVAIANCAGVLETAINTNGVLLNGAVAQRLLKAGIKRVKVSVDSIDPNKYKEIRGVELDEVVTNVKEFVRIRDSLNMDFPIVQVQMVSINNDKEEVKEYHNYWKDIVDYVGFCRLRGGDFDKSEYETVPCGQPFQRMLITWDGNVSVCCVDSELKFCIGNVKDNTIEELWNSQKANHIRNMHALGVGNKIKQCSECEINKIYPKREGNLFK